jgi:hypothetical protein
MNIRSELRLYMKGIATHHPQLLHSDTEGQQAFHSDKFSDVLDGVFRKALKPTGFCMRYIKPDITPQLDDSEGTLARAESGFLILKRIDDLLEADIEQAEQECSTIAKEIIARLMYDSRNGHELLMYSLNQLQQGSFREETIGFQDDGYWHGVLVTFQFMTEYIEDIDTLVTATNWTDL